MNRIQTSMFPVHFFLFFFLVCESYLTAVFLLLNKRLSSQPADVCLSVGREINKKTTALKRFVLSHQSEIKRNVGSCDPTVDSDSLTQAPVLLLCCCVDSLNSWILETIRCLKQNCNKPANSDFLLQRPDWLLFNLSPWN